MNDMSIRDFSRIALPFGISGGLLLMLRIYLDDSGTHWGSPFVVVGGLLGSESQWEQFDQDWKELLAAPLPGKPPLKKFHASECEARDGEFESYSIAERDFVTRKFRQVLIDSGVIGYSAAIDKVAWDELVVGELRENMSGAENFCVTRCVREMLASAYDHFSDDKVAIFYDIGRSRDTDRLKDFDFGRYISGPQVVSFSFAAVEDFTPLQGADMIATESYWYLKKWASDRNASPRPHLLHYLKTAKGNGQVMMRDGIMKEVAARNKDGTVKSEVLVSLKAQRESS